MIGAFGTLSKEIFVYPQVAKSFSYETAYFSKFILRMLFWYLNSPMKTWISEILVNIFCQEYLFPENV